MLYFFVLPQNCSEQTIYWVSFLNRKLHWRFMEVWIICLIGWAEVGVNTKTVGGNVLVIKHCYRFVPSNAFALPNINNLEDPALGNHVLLLQWKLSRVLWDVPWPLSWVKVVSVHTSTNVKDCPSARDGDGWRNSPGWGNHWRVQPSFLFTIWLPVKPMINISTWIGLTYSSPTQSHVPS